MKKKSNLVIVWLFRDLNTIHLLFCSGLSFWTIVCTVSNVACCLSSFPTAIPIQSIS